MSDLESQSLSSGNAFFGEEPERSPLVEVVDVASSTESSSSKSHSCSSGTDKFRTESMFQTVSREITTGENLVPLNMIKDGQFVTGSSSSSAADGVDPQAERCH